MPVTDTAHRALREQDIQTRVTKDRGPGGQHRNKTESCVVLTHLPTGLQAKAADRCQHANRRTARAVLEARVQAYYQEQENATVSATRKDLVGCGQRGDKVRTYSVQHGAVTDHRSGAKVALTRVLKGHLELLR